MIEYRFLVGLTLKYETRFICLFRLMLYLMRVYSKCSLDLGDSFSKNLKLSIWLYLEKIIKDAEAG